MEAYVLSSIEKQFSDNVGCKVIIGIEDNIEGINLGLAFSPSKVKWCELECKGVRVYVERKGVGKVYTYEFNQVRLTGGESQKITTLSSVLTDYMMFLKIMENVVIFGSDEVVMDNSRILDSIKKYYKYKGFISVDSEFNFVLPKLQ